MFVLKCELLIFLTVVEEHGNLRAPGKGRSQLHKCIDIVVCVHIVDKTMTHHGPMPPVTDKPGPKGLAPTQQTSQGTDSKVGPLEIPCGEGRKQVSEVPASSEG